MKIPIVSATAFTLLMGLSSAVAYADSPLSVSCTGTPGSSSITWEAVAGGGVAPYTLLWGNGATSSSQTLAYTPGTYAMSIQATDASSTTANSSCSGTVTALPIIASFTATPSSIVKGQSTTLSWNVSNASSTSINQGVGTVTGTSITVSPNTTTTYTLSAVNAQGTSTSNVTIAVNATSTSGSVSDQIKTLLDQLRAIQQQIAQLIAGQIIGSIGTTTPSHLPPGQIGKAACIALNRNLHEGDQGDDVKSIQQMLKDDGINLPITGFFGTLTMKAMMKFQIENGIASSTDGSVGPLTRGFFMRHCGEGLGKVKSEDASSTYATSTHEIEHGKSDQPHGNDKKGNDDNENDD